MQNNKQIPAQLTSTQSKFLSIPRTMDEITNKLFKGDQWAANHFQSNMLNSKQLVFENGKLSIPTYLENKDTSALILAAPKLLAACRMAKEELCFGGDWTNARKVLEAAIKEATK